MSEKDNKLLDLSREIVVSDYNSAVNTNKELFLNGDVNATSEYTYVNQINDALSVLMLFFLSPTRVISIIKKTKVGMDGLMIEIAKLFSTHPDNNFCLFRYNIYFITGMSNKSWENNMKNKFPTCFINNIFHHGKLQHFSKKIKNLKNALIIVDEIDSGDKEEQKLHNILKDLLDIKYMNENNIRFIFVSATMITELHQLNKWGDIHKIFHMTIPDNYASHNFFLENEIIKEYYKINNNETAERWVDEDIINNYGNDYRVHIIRIDEQNIKYIEKACKKNNIIFKNHTSDDRISHEDLKEIFNNIIQHVVIAIKGFYRRADLIPNEWKLKIGATHEKFVKKFDTNVQIQGLTGRMCGYWKDYIKNGHKTGPHRTSIDAIKEYDEWYKNPLSSMKYNTNGSKKVFVSPRNIKNLNTCNEYIKKLDAFKLLKIDNMDRNQIKKWCETNNFPNCDIINEIKEENKDTFIKNNGDLEYVFNENIEEFENKDDYLDYIEKNKLPTSVSYKKNKDNLFIKTNVSKKTKIYSYNELHKELKNIKKGSNLGVSYKDNGAEIGKKYTRLYISYKDINNPNTAIFTLRICEILKKRKILPKVNDNVKNKLYIVNDDKVKYSVIIDEFKDTLPQKYYFIHPDNWLYLHDPTREKK